MNGRPWPDPVTSFWTLVQCDSNLDHDDLCIKFWLKSPWYVLPHWDVSATYVRGTLNLFFLYFARDFLWELWSVLEGSCATDTRTIIWWQVKRPAVVPALPASGPRTVRSPQVWKAWGNPVRKGCRACAHDVLKVHSTWLWGHYFWKSSHECVCKEWCTVKKNK